VSKAHPLHRWLPENGEPRIPCESTNVTSRKPSPIDVAAVPAAFIRSGKRASRTGPSWAMNEGMVLVAPSSKTASNCGFETGSTHRERAAHGNYRNCSSCTRGRALNWALRERCQSPSLQTGSD
jgi:hypothetical protein